MESSFKKSISGNFRILCNIPERTQLWDRVSSENRDQYNLWLGGFSDWDFAADKMSVFMMIHLWSCLTYCILRILDYLTFSGEWYPSLFSIFCSVNKHVQCHVYISVTICLKPFIPITLIRQKSISTVVHWRDRPAAQLDTHWPVICFPINFWSRRRVVVP